MRIRPDRDDVDVGCRAVRRPEGIHVDAERHELDARLGAPFAEPLPQHVRLPVAVRENRRRRAQCPGIEPLHASRAELHETLGQPDRRVDEGSAHDAAPGEQHQRDSDGVDGGEHDICPVEAPKGREDRGEVSAVAARGLEAARQGGSRHRGRPGRGGSLEVVTDAVPADGELVHAVERVAGRGARFERERRTSVRCIAEEVEDGTHRLPPVT
jgi:hypothetical protein